jgi:hypothetical protein
LYDFSATTGPNAPIFNCSIDNGIPISVNASTSQLTRHSLLISESNLADRLHTLSMSVVNFNGVVWFFDYVIFTPSFDATASSLAGAQYFFDDTDPQIVYSGSWSIGDGTMEDMQNTLHTALSLNSSASLSFDGA